MNKREQSYDKFFVMRCLVINHSFLLSDGIVYWSKFVKQFSHVIDNLDNGLFIDSDSRLCLLVGGSNMEPPHLVHPV